MMVKDFITMKQMLQHIRQMGVDIVDIKIDSKVESIDIKKSLEQGKIVIVNEDKKEE